MQIALPVTEPSTTSIARDAQGNPLTITRPNGAVTTMTYDAQGNLLTSTEQAISATTSFTYDPTFNQVTRITDPKGNQTNITYDVKGNPLTITDADNNVTTFYLRQSRPAAHEQRRVESNDHLYL